MHNTFISAFILVLRRSSENNKHLVHFNHKNFLENNQNNYSTVKCVLFQFTFFKKEKIFVLVFTLILD